MRCGPCKRETRVIETRHTDNGVHRRRSCLNCGFRFSTVETMVGTPKPRQDKPNSAPHKPNSATQKPKPSKPAQQPKRADKPARQRDDDTLLDDVEDYGGRAYRDDLRDCGIDVKDFE